MAKYYVVFTEREEFTNVPELIVAGTFSEYIFAKVFMDVVNKRYNLHSVIMQDTITNNLT